MLANLGKKIFGTSSDRYLKRLIPTLQRVNELEKQVAAQDDAALAASTARFRERLERGESLEDMLAEAFATVREAAKRTLGMRHFDVQMLGGLVLHQGKIAEMKTGEGKTLVATLPVYPNALVGQGRPPRDRQRLPGPPRRRLDGAALPVPRPVGRRDLHGHGRGRRRKAYRRDITYGQNNEFGFDYLRDNMKFSVTEFAQRELFYAIVDEVDSILVDEARTPLIISGPAEDSTDKYYTINRVIPRLTSRGALHRRREGADGFLTEDGMARVEEILGIPNLYDPTADRDPPPREPGAARRTRCSSSTSTT